MTTKLRVKALYDCTADEPGELSFKEGDILVDVVESGEEGWYKGRIQNTSQTGLIPFNYVSPLSPPKQTRDTEQQQKIESKASGTTSGLATKDQLPTAGVDAFEAAMSPIRRTTKPTAVLSSPAIGSKSSADTSSSNSQNAPPILSPKPKLATTVGLGMTPSAATVFDKSELKPINRKGIETVLKPSQLALNNSKGSSPLEKVLSRNSSNSDSSASPSSRQNTTASFKSASNNGIALVGLANKSEDKSGANDVEDEDGYQMVKPSQIRQRFNHASFVGSNNLAKSTVPSMASPRPRTVASSKPLFSNAFMSSSPSNLSSADNSSTSSPKNRPSSTISPSRLDAVSSSSPMPRLPSRPVSAAGRKSRMSRMSTNSSLSSAPTSSATPTAQPSPTTSPPATENTTASTPPAIKPKPQSTSTLLADNDRNDKGDSSSSTQQQQPNLPPRPNNKLRSTSNPPPLQSKPSMSSIELLLSRNEQQKSQAAKKAQNNNNAPPIVAKKPSVPSPSLKTPELPTRPSLDSWVKDSGNTSSETVKPSTLFNRSRSATSPVSSGNDQDWLSIKNKTAPPQPHTQPPSARSKSPITQTIKTVSNTNDTAQTISTSSLSSPISNGSSSKKKATPPPPPPSRPPKGTNSNKASEKRYEALFNSIHDEGYIDGETAHFIWMKSKLSNEDLANIWRECDSEHKGLLNKEAFVEGMAKIDELLLQKQQLKQKQATAAM